MDESGTTGPVEDHEALAETIAVLRDPAAMRRLADSDAELLRGEEVTAEQLAEAIRRPHKPS